MSGSWSYGPQVSSSAPTGNGAPPLICFNCGQNHLLIHCPMSKNAAPAPPQAQANPPYQQYPGTIHSFQGYAHGGPVQPPHQPYSQNQQYGPVATQSQYSYVQAPPQQSYSAPPLAANHGNGPYQKPSTSQHSNAFPPQYSHPPLVSYQLPNSGQYMVPQNAAQYPTPMLPPPGNQQQLNHNENMNPSPSTFQGHSQPQWNNMPPPEQSIQAHQRPHRALSHATNNSHAPPPQSFQGRNRSQSVTNTVNTRTPTPKHMNQPNPAIRYNTLSASISQPKKSDTSTNRRVSDTSNVMKGVNKKIPSTTVTKPAPLSKEDVEKIAEDQQFEWDMAHIFADTPPKETIRLACPLSISFAMPPVRSYNPKSTVPVSRFVKDVTVTAFSRSIRDGPNWSALKIDPAFTELNTDSPLIPIDEVPRWMARRQGLTEYLELSPAPSRKRTRPEEVTSDESGGVSGRSVVPTVELESQEQTPPNKRHKNEQPDQAMGEAGTPVTVTLTYEARDGTPCLLTDDEAWAPEPGERACSPASSEDPTEALLASLGVTGAPKPISVGLLPNQPAYNNGIYTQPPYTNPEVTPYQNGINGNTANSQAQYGTFNQNLTQNDNSPNSHPQYSNAIVQHGNDPNAHHQVMGGSFGPAFNQPQDSQYGPGPGSLQGNTFHAQSSNNSGPLFNNGPVGHFRNGTNNNISTPNPLSAQSQSGPNRQNHNPFRQDSGYSSSGGSFSNSSSQEPHAGNSNSQLQFQQMPPPSGSGPKTKSQYGNGQLLNGNHPIAYVIETSDEEDILDEHSGSAADGSPLSPMSKEILGKLAKPSRKSCGSKKRPAPVVDEAYSRRW